MNSIPLVAPDIVFGFDGDGICAIGAITPNPPGCPFGPTGYEGPGVSFQSINAAQTSGVVVFNPPIPANGGTAYFGLELAIPSQCPDMDGDGLCDDWETNGLNVVVNGLNVFVNLPAMGADPRHKDIFILADYMVDPGLCIPILGCFFGHSHQPKLDAIALVTQAFANSPLNNPDGTTGVHLHVDCGPVCIMNPVTNQTWGALSMAHALTHQTALGATVGSNYQWAAFDVIKRANFSAARQQVFHYLVFGHDLGGLGSTSGISRGIPASDFLVTLGSWTNNVGTTLEQGGTLMHELGHNLSLRHGGADNETFKPNNHLTIMNYGFQTRGVFINGVGGTLDYSRAVVPNLNENALNENNGVNGGAALAAFGTLYYCGNAGHFVAAANGPIDWNCNGSSNEAAVSTDINKNGVKTVLTGGVREWPNVVFNGGAIGGLGVSVSQATQTPADEVDQVTDSTIPNPTGVTVAGPGATQVLAGGSATLVYTVTNIGSQADSYTLTFTSSQSWTTDTVPSSISLAAGQNQQITIHVNVPAGTSVGTAGAFALKAVSTTASALTDTAVGLVTAVGGAPQILGSVRNQVSNAGNNTVTLDLVLTDAGPGPAGNVVLSSIAIRTLGGTGTVTVASPTLPVTVGNLGVGGAGVVTLTFNVPTSVTRFSITETGTVTDATGASFNYSSAQSVIK